MQDKLHSVSTIMSLSPTLPNVGVALLSRWFLWRFFFGTINFHPSQSHSVLQECSALPFRYSKFNQCSHLFCGVNLQVRDFSDLFNGNAIFPVPCELFPEANTTLGHWILSQCVWWSHRFLIYLLVFINEWVGWLYWKDFNCLMLGSTENSIQPGSVSAGGQAVYQTQRFGGLWIFYIRLAPHR